MILFAWRRLQPQSKPQRPESRSDRTVCVEKTQDEKTRRRQKKMTPSERKQKMMTPGRKEGEEKTKDDDTK